MTAPASLRERAEAFLRTAGLDLPEREPVDPDACTHPVRSLRFDGCWPLDPVQASVTCGRCRTSLMIPVRPDVAERVLAGGPLGPESVESPMSDKSATPAPRAQCMGAVES